MDYQVHRILGKSKRYIYYPQKYKCLGELQIINKYTHISNYKDLKKL